MGGVDRNYFTIDQQGQFSFREDSPPNFEQPSDSGGDNVYEVTIEVTRRHKQHFHSLPITVTVRDVNEPPDVAGTQTLSFTENQSTDLVLATYSAIDPEEPSAVITRWSTSGTDGGDFTIDENGQLRFKNVPNYESPADSGRRQRLQLLGQSIGRKTLRIPARHGDSHRRERAANHHHGQQLSDHASVRMRTGPHASTLTGPRTPRRGR